VIGELKDGSINTAEQPRFLSKKRLDDPQCRSRPFGEEKNILPLPGFEPRLVHRVAQSLYRYLCSVGPSFITLSLRRKRYAGHETRTVTWRNVSWLEILTLVTLYSMHTWKPPHSLQLSAKNCDLITNILSSRRHPNPQAFGGRAVGRSYLMHILKGIWGKSFEIVITETQQLYWEVHGNTRTTIPRPLFDNLFTSAIELVVRVL